MRNILLLFVIIFQLCSCKETIERPSIPEERLVELLADLHMVEMAMHQVPKHAKDSMRTVYKDQLLEIYSLTEDSLNRNIQVLQNDPEYYFEISKKVADLTKKDKRDYDDE
jgi:hypothetical protein